MVIAKPIQFTIVSAVPFISAGAFCATIVEKRGESAITTIPQNIRNPTNIYPASIEKNRGDVKQHIQDSNSDQKAIFLAPKISERYPLKTQAILPIPIIKKEHMGILSDSSLCIVLYEDKMTGTNVQKAYSSHICPK